MIFKSDMTLKLFIGNKNYSSWSMRPWVALKASGIAFDETMIPLYTGPADKQRILDVTPSGTVNDRSAPVGPNSQVTVVPAWVHPGGAAAAAIAGRPSPASPATSTTPAPRAAARRVVTLRVT